MALCLLFAVNARAQSEESELPPAPGEFAAASPSEPVQPFFVPDVPQSVVEQTQVRERWFTLKVGVVVLVALQRIHLQLVLETVAQDSTPFHGQVEL